jgi:hypothetical protein
MEHSSEMPGFVLSFWKERAGGLGGWASLQDLALGSLLSAGAQESGTGSGLEHFADALVGSCGTFKVLVCADLLADFLTLLWC